MAGKLDIGMYRSVLAIREAYRFDIGTAFMRVFQFSITVGMVSMLTLAGYSAFWAGTVASLAALCTFVISPFVSKRIDRDGQRAIVPKAIAITIVGLATILATVALEGPVWVCYVGAVLMGFLPSSPALARARWTYLLESGKLGDRAPELKTVFSYEGIIEDIAFMVGPAFTVAVGSMVAPAAGMAVLGVLLAVGTVLLVSSRGTEPDEDFRTAQIEKAEAEAEASGPKRTQHLRSMFLESGTVRMLFFGFLLMGTYFGVLNTTEIAFTEAIGIPTAVSGALMGSAIVSATGGFIFGMMRIKAPVHRQYVIIGIIVGIGYTFMILIDSIPKLYAVSWIPVVFYAPFLITSSALCQARVPKERLTESLTWMNNGTVCGMAVGPTLAGFFIDSFGWPAGFAVGGAAAAMLAVAAALSTLLWRRKV